MSNNEIIMNTVKSAFSPEQIAQLTAAIFTPEQIAKHQQMGMEPAEILASSFHTFAEWKRLGYSVKKGQKSPICCMLWKYTDKPGKSAKEAAAKRGAEEPEHDPHFYMAKSHLFHFLQVEPCKA